MTLQETSLEPAQAVPHGNTPNLPMVVPPKTTDQDESPPQLILSKALASWFVRRNGRYYDVQTPGQDLSKDDVERIAISRFSTHFPDIKITDELIRLVFQHVIIRKHADPSTTIQVWDGREVCRPDLEQRLVPQNGQVSLNTFEVPAYRSLNETGSDMRIFDLFLEKIMHHAVDRQNAKDWLSWSLQNEFEKPSYALFLYSAQKGTGKSTFIEVCSRLFGKNNTMVQNGVGQLTGRFNRPLLSKKLIVLEEVKLKQGTSASNALKTFITETFATTEAKGKEMEAVEQRCCFVCSSNHFPAWIEGGERRYNVIEVGDPEVNDEATRREFRRFVGGFLKFIADDQKLARLYNALMQYQQSAGFDPKGFDAASIDTPVMKRFTNRSDSIHLSEFRELLQEDGRKAIPHSELRTLCRTNLQMAPTQIPHLMGELGWTTSELKWGGKDYRRSIYVHPKAQVGEGLVYLPDGSKIAIGEQTSGLDSYEGFEVIESSLKPGDVD